MREEHGVNTTEHLNASILLNFERGQGSSAFVCGGERRACCYPKAVREQSGDQGIFRHGTLGEAEWRKWRKEKEGAAPRWFDSHSGI
jgi:hypothetical protein